MRGVDVKLSVRAKLIWASNGGGGGEGGGGGGDGGVKCVGVKDGSVGCIGCSDGGGGVSAAGVMSFGRGGTSEGDSLGIDGGVGI